MTRRIEIATIDSFYLERGFGFLSIPGEPDMFFHYNQGQFVAPSRYGYPVFSGNSRRTSASGNVEHLPIPKAGDVVRFYRQLFGNRYRANPWGFESQWQEAVATIASRNQTQEGEVS